MTNASKIGEDMIETIEMFNMKYHKRVQLFARFEMNEFGFHLHLNGRQVENPISFNELYTGKIKSQVLKSIIYGMK